MVVRGGRVGATEAPWSLGPVGPGFAVGGWSSGRVSGLVLVALLALFGGPWVGLGPGIGAFLDFPCNSADASRTFEASSCSYHVLLARLDPAEHAALTVVVSA